MRFAAGPVRVEAAEVTAFAARFDPQPFHLDDAAARRTLFGGLAASGWHTAALSMRLITEALPLAGGVISTGGEVQWPRFKHTQRLTPHPPAASRCRRE